MQGVKAVNSVKCVILCCIQSEKAWTKPEPCCGGHYERQVLLLRAYSLKQKQRRAAGEGKDYYFCPFRTESHKIWDNVLQRFILFRE